MQANLNKMPTSNCSHVAETAGPDRLLRNARQLGPFLEDHAVAQETARQLAPEVIEALHRSGLFGVYAPPSVGGADLKPTQALSVIEAVAQADPPTAWVLFATGLCIGAAGAYLGESAIDELFKGPRMPIVAGQGIPNGRAVVEKGGYRLSGRWNYGSGVRHSDVIHTGAVVFENGSPRLDSAGAPEVRIFHVPREQVSFGDNWHVLGLKATGSIDYAVEDVFVEEDWTYFARSVRPRDGKLYRAGTIGVGALSHSAFALGVARRVLDALAAFAQTRTGRPGMIGESESFLEGYAQAEAQCRAARAFVFEAWEDAERSLEEGDVLSTRQITLVRLALNHATWTAAAACDFAYKAAGGTSLRDGVIQRCFRDMHAGTQHITSAPSMLRECGRDLAGLALGKTWSFMGLVDKAAT